jgi:hypothetical protein
LQSIHACVHGASPTLTLRFDSQGMLTHFGMDADADDGADAACLDTMRSHRPAVTFPGPATVRCGERCTR